MESIERLGGTIMAKIKIYFKFINSSDFGVYNLIVIPELAMSDFISDSCMRDSLKVHFGPLWVVVWKCSRGLPSLITNEKTQNISPTEIERHLNGRWKTKYVELNQ